MAQSTVELPMLCGTKLPTAVLADIFHIAIFTTSHSNKYGSTGPSMQNCCWIKASIGAGEGGLSQLSL